MFCEEMDDYIYYLLIPNPLILGDFKKKGKYIYILALEVIIIMWMRISNPLGKMWPWRYYLPTPPLGQDMTQGQFLSGV